MLRWRKDSRRHAQDKARVERAVPGVRDDCFAGEILTTLEDARAHARRWCRDDYGWRPHSRTQRRPREHFEAEEQAALLPVPTTPYDIPLWSEPKVGRDQVGGRRQGALLGAASASILPAGAGRRTVARCLVIPYRWASYASMGSAATSGRFAARSMRLRSSVAQFDERDGPS